MQISPLHCILPLPRVNAIKFHIEQKEERGEFFYNINYNNWSIYSKVMHDIYQAVSLKYKLMVFLLMFSQALQNVNLYAN
jgi:hypothetical protein